MKQDQPRTRLNNGRDMPLLGLGVYTLKGPEVVRICREAFDIGYRLIDTASMYGNEAEVGEAIRTCGLPREEIFLTTKVANQDQGFQSTLRAFEESLKKLDAGYIDLYLIHWPIRGKRKDSWKALEQLYLQQRVRSIGVANYLLPFLRELETYAKVVAALNQLEFSPFLYLQEELSYCREKGIKLQAYAPLTRGHKLRDPGLLLLAEKYHKTPAQLILRWNLEQGISVIPKSSRRERLQENFEILDFRLSPEDILLMNGFHEDFRVVESPIQML